MFIEMVNKSLVDLFTLIDQVVAELDQRLINVPPFIRRTKGMSFNVHAFFLCSFLRSVIFN